MSERLASALVDALEHADLARLADRLAPYMVERLDHAGEWMDTGQAADYLRISRSRLQRLAKAREVPAHQEVPNGKYSFRRSELDEWRHAQRVSGGRAR